MNKTRTLALTVSACLFGAAAQAAAWRAYTTQDLVPVSGTFLSVDACNTAAGDEAACGGYDEIGIGFSIDRGLSTTGGWQTRGVADLSLAAVSITGSGPFPYDRALSSAGFSDLLNFDIPGLLLGAEAEVGLRLVFDGSFVDGSKVGMIFSAGNPLDLARFKLAGSAEWKGTFNGGFFTPVAAVSFSLAVAPSFQNDTVFDPRWITTGQTMFEGSVKIRGDAPSLPLQLLVYGNGELDLSSTGRLTLVLPPGSTFASESGVFLSAIPEPGSALLLALGGLGLAALRPLRGRLHGA